MPSWINTELWTPGVARLVSVGGIDIGKGGKGECKDVYAFVLADGIRPIAAGENANVSGIPEYGEKHPDVDGLTVSNISFAQEVEHSRVWRATVTYSGSEDDKSEEGSEEEWEYRYTRLHIGTVAETRELTEDADNQTPVVNSAGDPFESVPQVERHLIEIILTRNQDTLPDMDLNGSVNASLAKVAGIDIAAKCGRIAIEAERTFGGKWKWSVSFRIVVNPDTWQLEVFQNGYRYKDSAGQLVKFTETTADGRVVECSSPQLLGPVGDGGDGRGRGPYYASFAAYPSKSWASLNLPKKL